MKKIIIKYTIVTLLAAGIFSCSDYLNVIPEGTPTVDNAFSNRANAERSLFGCYSFLPRFDVPSSTPGLLGGDEIWVYPLGTGFIDSRLGGVNAWQIGRGEQNTVDPYLNFWDGLRGGNPSGHTGAGLWVAIRECNVFLDNIHKPQDLPGYERERWIAEVTFLKAYYHFFLLKTYGPIPIMDNCEPVTADIETLRRFRDPVDEVVAYIEGLLDKAMGGLPLMVPEPASELGRITQPIVAAVKAQLLLLAASPQFNGHPFYADIRDSRGVYLFPRQNDPNKWTRAAEAAKEAIDLALEAKHEIWYFTETVAGISETTHQLLTIGEIVSSPDRWSAETIWGSSRTNTAGGDGTLTMLALAPVTQGGTGRGTASNIRNLWSPTLSAVERFYSSNGVPIEEDNSAFWQDNYADRHSLTTVVDEGINKYTLVIGRQTPKMHLNRELRFYANLYFDGGTVYMHGYPNDNNATLGRPIYLMGQGLGYQNDQDYSITGYGCKKLVGYRTGVGASGGTVTPWRYAFPIIRLADLYLMYAEALNESLNAPNKDVYDAVDVVRARASLKGVVESWANHSINPTKPASKEGMREIIRRERLNELAFEGKRFWDMRRWMEEPIHPIQGWNVRARTYPEFYQVTNLFEPPRYTFKDFLWPIRLDQIQKNPNLMQNPGW